MSKVVNRLPRPSSMPLLDQCPRFVSAPRDKVKKSAMDEAAEEGTFLHAYMEHLTEEHKIEDWPTVLADDIALSPVQTPLIEDTAAQVKDLFSLGLPVISKHLMGLKPDDHYMLETNAKDGVYLEVSVAPLVTQPGTADVLMVKGSAGVMVDYKFTRLERDHKAQMDTYVVGVFEALPELNVLEVRIVAPRLGNAHMPVVYYREDLPRLRSYLQKIVDNAKDPFTPGNPGYPCSFCAGNGRCVWQMSSLEGLPSAATGTGVVLRDVWKPVLNPVTPETRGVRRNIRAWLTKWLDAIKEDDVAWAIENPEAILPGWKKSICLGRTSIDNDRAQEIAFHINTMYGIEFTDMFGFMNLNKGKAADYIALTTGTSVAEAKRELNKTLAPFTRRGANIVKFTPVKHKKKAISE